MQVLQDINANVHAEASLDTVVGLHSYTVLREAAPARTQPTGQRNGSCRFRALWSAISKVMLLVEGNMSVSVALCNMFNFCVVMWGQRRLHQR